MMMIQNEMILKMMLKKKMDFYLDGKAQYQNPRRCPRKRLCESGECLQLIPRRYNQCHHNNNQKKTHIRWQLSGKQQLSRLLGRKPNQ